MLAGEVVIGSGSFEVEVSIADSVEEAKVVTGDVEVVSFGP